MLQRFTTAQILTCLDQQELQKRETMADASLVGSCHGCGGGRLLRAMPLPVYCQCPTSEDRKSCSKQELTDTTTVAVEDLGRG